jgi:hypothetical protein
MRKIKNLLTAVLIGLGVAAASDMKAQVISPTFFGQNAWMPDTIGNINNAPQPPVVFGGKLHQSWQKVKASGTKYVRFGGIAPDRNMPTNFQYIKMIDSIRANGMEPIIQVPYHNGRYSAQQAAAIVNYINKVRGKNVVYWSIGNEPDLEYAFTSASQVSGYIKSFASAMKAIDPSIKIMGPECAWYNQNIINGLTTPNGPDDITGTDQYGRYYIDVVSFHYYGFGGTQTRAQVLSKLTDAGGLKDNLALLNGRINNCNTAHNRTGLNALRTAITEANLCYQNPGGDNLWGQGVNSFVGGQFIAEMLGVAMKNNVGFVNMWSVVEGNGVALNIGYLDPSTGNKKPAYYHYQMVAENFKGNVVNATATQANVKVMASQNAAQTAVLILNQDQGANYNYTVRLNNNTVSGNNPLKISVNANINVEYNGSINNQTSILLVFNSAGNLVKKIEYSLTNHAANNQPPTVNVYGNMTTGEEEGNSETANLKGFHINMFPNPANTKFTIQLDRRNPEQKKFTIEIFDIMGRLVHERTTVFNEQKQEMDLSGSTLASAVYIVRVHEQDDKDNTQSEKIILFKQ